MTKSEPILSGTNAAPAVRQKPNRSGGAGRKRGVGKMNSRPALAFAAAKIRANIIGTPPIYKIGVVYPPDTAYQ